MCPGAYLTTSAQDSDVAEFSRIGADAYDAAAQAGRDSWFVKAFVV